MAVAIDLIFRICPGNALHHLAEDRDQTSEIAQAGPDGPGRQARRQSVYLQIDRFMDLVCK